MPKNKRKRPVGFKKVFQRLKNAKIRISLSAKPLKIIISIVALLVIADSLIQLYFLSKVASYSTKGLIITKNEMFNAFIKEINPTTADLLLQSITAEKIIKREAKKAGITVTEEELEAELNQILTQNNLTLEALLAQTGLSEEELRETLRLNVLMKKLVPIDYTPTEEEIQQFYENNKDFLFAEKSLEEVREEVIRYLQASRSQQAYGNWFQERLNYYTPIVLLYDKPAYKPVAGLNYYLPILINTYLDLELKTPFIKFDLPQFIKKN